MRSDSGLKSGPSALALRLLCLLLAGCASGLRPREYPAFTPGPGEERVHGRKRSVLQQQREVATPVREAAEPRNAGASALQPYLEFIREKRQWLERSAGAEEEKRREQRVLGELHSWALRQSEASLRRNTPLEVYVELDVALKLRERAQAEHQAAVQAKLEEFFDWAERRWAQVGHERVRALDSRHLLTEHPLRTYSQDALAGAVLDWAMTHSQDRDFVRKSPSEVALYLLARRSALATALELGRYAPPHLDYTPPRDTKPSAEELTLELLAGILPGIGEALDAAGYLTGYSLTGRKLEANERLLSGVAVLVPFVPGRGLAGMELAERAALMTGRSVSEVRVLQRVASHLSPADTSRVEALLKQVARGGELSEEEGRFLQRLALKLEKPLSEAAEVLRRGGKVPLVGSRLGEAGLRLEPGTAEHMAAAWVDYQFRHPNKYPRFSYAIDDTWRKQYETILKNKEVGGDFEQKVLKARGQEKNRALLMPPPGSTAQGFIPDAVPRSPTPGELVWGQPYHFVEAKARKNLTLGGNLEAMLRYVQKYGGHVELWVRSAKHPEGPSRWTAPLERLITELAQSGRASLNRYP